MLYYFLMPDCNEELIILPIGEPGKDVPDYQDVFQALVPNPEYPSYELPEPEAVIKSGATAKEVTEALKKTLGR